MLARREQLPRLAAARGRRPHGDAQWTLGRDTSPEIEIDRSTGGALPTFRIALPARPEDPDAPVEKTTVVFHVLIKKLW